jgi:hypothetical protein
VDRFGLLDQLLEMELKYQNAKVELLLVYMESYEHISDPVEQQRMLQIMVDLMAKRPRLNLNASHFNESYLVEIRCFKVQRDMVAETLRLLMHRELELNTDTREYLEKSYKLVMEVDEKKLDYVMPEQQEAEIEQREKF